MLPLDEWSVFWFDSLVAEPLEISHHTVLLGAAYPNG